MDESYQDDVNEEAGLPTNQGSEGSESSGPDTQFVGPIPSRTRPHKYAPKGDKWKDERPRRKQGALRVPGRIAMRHQLAEYYPRIPSQKHEKRGEISIAPPLGWSEFDVSQLAVTRSRKAFKQEFKDEFLMFRESRLKQHALEYLKIEFHKLLLQATLFDVQEARYLQQVKLKLSIVEEDANRKVGDWSKFIQNKCNTREEKDSIQRRKENVMEQAVVLSRWRRECHDRDVQMGRLRKASETSVSNAGIAVESQLNKVLSICGYDTTGLHVLQFPAGKRKVKWTQIEERRLRSGFHYFGRDWYAIQRYLKTDRLPHGEFIKANDRSKIKSKIQKLLVVWRKCALPLPESIKHQTQKYTMKGLESLNIRSNIWTETLTKLQEKIPLYDVPFGRRHYVVPNAPLYVNLLSDEQFSI